MNDMKQTVLTSMILAILAPVAAFAQIDDVANHWTFDDATGRSVSDLRGGANGVMQGESKGFGWASGKGNTSLGFDGKDGIGVTLPDGILKGSEGTLAFWIKLNALNERNVIFSARSTSDNNIYMMLAVDNDGRPVFIVRDVASGNERLMQATKILNPNEWYHIVFTADTRSYHVYVNGEDAVLAGENTGRWIPDFTNHALMYRIGTIYSSSRIGSLDGYLDDMRVYTRAITGADAKELFTTTNAFTPNVPQSIMPKLDFSVSANTVPYGGSVALRWEGVNVTSCTKSGSWSGSASVKGEEVVVKIGGDSAYTLTCGGGKGGDVSSTVKVSVSTTTQTLKPQGTITVLDNMTPSSSVLIDPKGMTKAELIKAILAKIAELQALLKTMQN